MGTFLKVVGIIVIILAIVGFVFSLLISISGIINKIPFVNQFNNILQVSFIVVSAVFYFFITVFGVSLFVLGSIYNNVLELNKNFKSAEIVKE